MPKHDPAKTKLAHWFASIEGDEAIQASPPHGTPFDTMTFNYVCPTRECHTVGQIVGGGMVTCTKCGAKFSVVPSLARFPQP